jgi:diguanylate cyclase (GGDEF)-like protein
MVRENVSIAVVAPLQPDYFFDLLWEGVWEATFDLGAFGVQVQNLVTGRYDPAGQRDILTSLLESEIDGIAILPAHSTALDPLIAEHERRGRPVITFHGDAPASGRSAFVGPNSRAAGALAADVLSKLMRGNGRILSFPGPGERYHCAQRYEGMRAELVRQSGLLESEFPSSDRVTPELIAALRLADGVYVGFQNWHVATALEQAGLNIPCVAFSNTEPARGFLERKVISAVIDENRYLQGYFAVQKTFEAVEQRRNGATLDGITIPSTVAFAANARELNESLNNAFEMLVSQRTKALCSYKDRLEQANRELLNLSITDSLTGLLNRRRFEEVMQQEVARAHRYGPLALLMIDLDYFKLVNDRFGHPAGDEALKTVAGVLKSCCRSTDICARLGGDEFAVILPHNDGRAAAIVRDRIQREIARTPFLIAGRPLTLRLSIGAASLPDDANTAEALIAAADRAMYAAKQASRSQPIPA